MGKRNVSDPLSDNKYNNSKPRASDFRTMSAEGRVSLGISWDFYTHQYIIDLVMSHSELRTMSNTLDIIDIKYEGGAHYEGGGRQMIIRCSRDQLVSVLTEISTRLPAVVVMNDGDVSLIGTIRE